MWDGHTATSWRSCFSFAWTILYVWNKQSGFVRLLIGSCQVAPWKSRDPYFMAYGIFPTCNWVVFHPRITQTTPKVLLTAHDFPRILGSKTVIQVSWVVCFNLPWITIRKELQYGNSAILFWRIGCQTIQAVTFWYLYLESFNHFKPRKSHEKMPGVFFLNSSVECRIVPR